MNDLELLELQSETLLVLDRHRRLLALNEPGRPPAPYFFLGRSERGNLWRCRSDLPEKLYRALDAAAASEPVTLVSSALPHRAEVFSKLLGASFPVRHVWSGPAYVFPETLLSPTGVVRVTRENLSELGEMVTWLGPHLELKEPCFAALEHGRAVAVCHSARSTPSAAEAGVETQLAARGRGYGSAVVAAWARAVQQEERTPLYSTAWSNLASQKIAHKLGLRRYGSDYHLS